MVGAGVSGVRDEAFFSFVAVVGDDFNQFYFDDADIRFIKRGSRCL